MTRRVTSLLIAGLGIALVLAVGVSHFASTAPDGLERVALDKGLDRDEQPHPLAGGPLSDYTTAGVHNGFVATGLAGAVGVLATFLLATGIVGLAARQRHRHGPDPSPVDSPVDSPEAGSTP